MKGPIITDFLEKDANLNILPTADCLAKIPLIYWMTSLKIWNQRFLTFILEMDLNVIYTFKKKLQIWMLGDTDKL